MVGRAIRTGVIVLLGLQGAVAADPTAAIRLNTIGYPPDATKEASIPNAQGRFEVVRTADGSVAFAGELSSAAPNADTQEELSTADFTALTTAGEYRLMIAGVGESAPFRIGADVYRQPFYLVTRAMYLWRCGTAVTAEHQGRVYRHEACHLDDAYLDFVGGPKGQRLASVGGWHDAGDYNKYVVNAGATVGVMFKAWDDFSPQIQAVALDLPESGGNLPDFLAELKWELQWLLTMQTDDGSVYHKVSTRSFGGFILPEDERERRYFVSPGSAATADFAAMTAMASRRFAPYDAPFAQRCLDAARKAYEWLRAHPVYQRADQRGFRTGGYETRDADDRLWADAEIWEATGGADALAAVEAQLKDGGGQFDVDWDWGNVKNLGLLAYLSSRRPGRDPQLVKAVETSLKDAARRIADAAAAHGYARPLGETYYWGCNGTVARQAVVLEAAYRLTADERYRSVQLDALNHLFGRNCYGRSFVTGLGHRPPMRPHDRRSGADDVDNPWPGYLVGGAHPQATDWRDDQEDFRTNEIAINWNAALIYALAAQLPPAPKGK